MNGTSCVMTQEKNSISVVKVFLLPRIQFCPIIIISLDWPNFLITPCCYLSYVLGALYGRRNTIKISSPTLELKVL